jgi:hypothetical protein
MESDASVASSTPGLRLRQEFEIGVGRCIKLLKPSYVDSSRHEFALMPSSL